MTVSDLIEALSVIAQAGHGDAPVLVPDTANDAWVEVDAPVATPANEGETVVRFLLDGPEVLQPSPTMLQWVADQEAKDPARKDNPVWRENVSRLLG